MTQLFPNESNIISSYSGAGVYLCVGDGGSSVGMSGSNVGMFGNNCFIWLIVVVVVVVTTAPAE